MGGSSLEEVTAISSSPYFTQSFSLTSDDDDGPEPRPPAEREDAKQFMSFSLDTSSDDDEPGDTKPGGAINRVESKGEHSEEKVAEVTARIQEIVVGTLAQKDIQGTPGLTENLWGWGLSSLSAVSISDQLKEEWGVELTHASVMAGFSIKGMASAVLSNIEVESEIHYTPDEIYGLNGESRRVQAGLPPWFRCLWGIWMLILINSVTGVAMAPIFVFEKWVWHTSDDHFETTYSGLIPSGYSFHSKVATVRLFLMMPFYILMFVTGILLTSLIFKWTLIGRFEPCRHPIWSWYGCRRQLVLRMLACSESYFIKWFHTTPMHNFWLQCLGTHIGRNVWMGAYVAIIEHDMLYIEDDVVIEDGVMILPCFSIDGTYEESQPIVIARGSYLCRSCVLMPGSTIGDPGRGIPTQLDQTPLLASVSGPSATVYHRQLVQGHLQSCDQDQAVVKSLIHPAQSGVGWTMAMLLGLALELCSIGSCVFAGVAALDAINVKMNFVGAKLVYFFPVFLLVMMSSCMCANIILKWLVIGRVKPGTHTMTGFQIWRYWFYIRMCTLTHTMILPWFTWCFPGNLYQVAMGLHMSIINTFSSDLTWFHLNIDLLSLGDNTFVAGNTAIICWEIDGNTIKASHTDVGGCGYIGNSSVTLPRCHMEHFVTVADQAVVPADTTIYSTCYVIGYGQHVGMKRPALSSVMTSSGECTAEQIQLAAEWELLVEDQISPDQNQMNRCADQADELHQTLSARNVNVQLLNDVLLMAGRLRGLGESNTMTWHLWRILSILYLFWVITAGFIASSEVLRHTLSSVGRVDGLDFFRSHKFFGPWPAQFCFLWRFLTALVTVAVWPIAALLNKWLLLGRVSTTKGHDMDSFFMIAYSVTNSIWSLSLITISAFAGTPIFSFVFRLFGTDVGQDVELHSLEFLADFDVFQFGDRSFLAPSTFLQCHTFVNQSLGFGAITLGKDALVTGASSVFVSDSHVSDHAIMGPCSTVMRGGRVPEREYWQGNPASRCPVAGHIDPRAPPVQPLKSSLTKQLL